MKTVSLLATSVVLLSLTLLACSTGTPAPVVQKDISSSVSPSAAPVSANSPTQKEILESINLKALNSLTFAGELKANPEVVLKAAGITPSATTKIKVVDFLNPEGDLYFILDDRNLMHFYPEILKKAESTDEVSEELKMLRAIREKAISDPVFKAQLVSDTFNVLKKEGLNEAVALKFKILDYEPGTDFVLILPPDSNAFTRSTGSPFFDSLVATAVSTVKNSLLFQNDPDGVIRAAADVAFAAVEVACFIPRIFGASCGISKVLLSAAIKKVLVTPTPSPITNDKPTTASTPRPKSTSGKKG